MRSFCWLYAFSMMSAAFSSACFIRWLARMPRSTNPAAAPAPAAKMATTTAMVVSTIVPVLPSDATRRRRRCLGCGVTTAVGWGTILAG